MEILDKIINSITKNRALWVAGTLFFFILIILYVFLFNSNQPDRKIIDTPLSYSENFGHLDESYLYMYNGIAFIRTDLSLNNNKETETLATEFKLPSPSSIHWAGESGALMTFEGSFIMTDVEAELSDSNIDVDQESRNYVWYMDFQDNDLQIVNRYPIQNNLVAFSEAKNGFYYIPDYSQYILLEDGDKPPDQNSLHFFDISSGEDQVIIEDLDINNISHLSLCDASEVDVCAVARDPESRQNDALFGVSGSQKELLLQPGGRMFPTNDSSLFVSIDGSSPGDDLEFVDYDPGRVRVHDITEGSSKRLGFEVDGDVSIMSYFDEEGDFYALQNPPLQNPRRSSFYMFHSGSLRNIGSASSDTLNLVFEDGEPFESGILDFVSFGDGGRSLITSYEDEQFIFSADDDVLSISEPEQREAETTIDECVELYGETSQFNEETQTFRIFIDSDDNFQSNIGNISNCIAENDDRILQSYQFRIDALDPFTGRIISN